MPDKREEYNDQFVGNDWAHYLIRRIDPSKSKDTNLAILLNTGIKKVPLKKVVDFLKNNFAAKYPKAVEVFVKKANLRKSDLSTRTSYFPLTEENRSVGEQNGKVNLFPVRGSSPRNLH